MVQTIGSAGVLLCLVALQVSRLAPALPIRVVGIIVGAGDAVCVIRCTDRPESWGLFRTGQRACGVADVQEIRRDRITVRDAQTNRSETLVLAVTANAGGVAAPAAALPERATAPPPIEVPKAAVERYLANLPDVLSSALATPRTREVAPGQTVIDGFEISQVKPGGVAEQLGLQNGDVILEVNGQPLDGMPTIMRLLAQLRSATETKLTVLRDGQRITLAFNSR